MKREYARSFFGELFGSFLLVFMGSCAVAGAVLFASFVGTLQVAAVWGGGAALSIYITRHLSCAHLNPAVSLAMVLSGRMAYWKLPLYWVAQLAGSILAGALVYYLFNDAIACYELTHQIIRGTPASIKTAMILCDYFPNPAVANFQRLSLWSAFAVEAGGTFLLVMAILSLTDGCNVGRPPDALAPLVIGFTLAIIIAIFSPFTQAGLNPARDFGPRLVAYAAGWGEAAIPGPRGGFFWVYVLGPLAGGFWGATFFNFALKPLLADEQDLCDACSLGGRMDV